MTHQVLIVDDDESMLHILGLILDRAGYKTLTADNGEDALQMIYNHRPSIVILDEMMPGLSGGEVCSRIKKDELLRSTPIIMHSAGTQIQSEAYLRRIGADAALAKPCPPKKVVETVATILGR
ncbi:MAG: response regulator [bacterium]|nr:response regulator [bacterium]